MKASKNQAVNVVIVVVTILVGSACLCVLIGWDTVLSFFANIF